MRSVFPLYSAVGRTVDKLVEVFCPPGANVTQGLGAAGPRVDRQLQRGALQVDLEAMREWASLLVNHSAGGGDYQLRIVELKQRIDVLEQLLSERR